MEEESSASKMQWVVTAKKHGHGTETSKTT